MIPSPPLTRLQVPLFAHTTVQGVLLVVQNLTTHMYMPGDYVGRYHHTPHPNCFSAMPSRRVPLGGGLYLTLTHYPNSQSVHYGDVGDSMFFVRRGVCDVYVPNQPSQYLRNSLELSSDVCYTLTLTSSTLTLSLQPVEKRSHTAQMRRVKQLVGGDYFGELSLLSGERRTATICCVTVCDLARLHTDALQQVIERHPEFAEEMMKG